MLTFGAAVSTALDHQQALDEVIPAALDQLGGAPDLVVCFFSMEHAGAAAGIALSLSERTGTSAILGCTAQGVIGGGRELEEEPGLAVWMARLPGVDVRPFALRVIPLGDGVGIGGWPDLPPDDRTSALVLAAPFPFPADSFLERLNQEQPGLPVVGGMVSGALESGRHRLVSGTDVLDSGAAGGAPTDWTGAPPASPSSARSTSARWSARAAGRWARRSPSPGARATSSTSWAAGRRSTGCASSWPAPTGQGRSGCG